MAYQLLTFNQIFFHSSLHYSSSVFLAWFLDIMVDDFIAEELVLLKL